MTSTDWFEIAIIVVLILVVAFNAATEVAITRTNRVRALRLVEEGRRGAVALSHIAENPANYLNVVLLLTLLATIGGTTIATSFAVRHWENAGEIISTVAMTILLFVFAEVTPKTFAIQQTDRVGLMTAPILVFLTRLVGPLAKGLLKFANVIMPGKGLKQGPYITEQELRASAEVASEEGEIEDEEKELIHSIFEFGDTIVREVMVPRPDIVAMEDDKTLRDVQALVLEHGYSRVPVYREDLDDVAGMIYAKDVLKALHQGKHDSPLSEIVREPHYIPETKKVAELLREMQRDKFHIALVTDEYGSVSGLVTLEDLLEELVGEIADEYDREEPELVPVGDGLYRVSGKASIDDVNELLDVELPDEEWDTVAGLMLELFGRIPKSGDEVTFEGLTFTAEEVQGRRISKVLIAMQPDPDGHRERGDPRMSPIGDDIVDGLVAAASEARERFYAPYSGFAVGAAILAGGRTFVGVNIENASYPLSVCAERNAVAAMIVGGERRIEAVAVVAGGDGPASPCGGCRQVLAEFAADDVPVVSEHVEGERARWTVGELLPDAFRLTP